MTERTGYNNLKIVAYGSGATPLITAASELRRAEGLRFATGYPGGLFLDADFFIPRRRDRTWTIKQGQRLAFFNRRRLLFEGKLSSYTTVLSPQDEGKAMRLTGLWGDLMMKRRWRKRWIDNRITDSVWTWQTDATAAEFCTVDRTGRIRFTPKAEAWGDGEYAAVKYTMPTGETVKRITYTYDLKEAAQAWEISVWRSTDDVTYTQMTGASGETYATGTTTVITADAAGNIDVTLATPSQYLELRFYARAAQTPTSDGTYYGEFTVPLVYSETGSINLTEIAKDVRAEVTDLNSYEGEIDSNGLALSPFIAEQFETMADILTRAASFGDSSFNAWAVGLRSSELVAAPDGKPVLFAEQQPSLSDCDYVVRFEDTNLEPIVIEWTLDDMVNDVIVGYTDLSGVQQWITSDDAGFTTLKDTISITTFGQRQAVIQAGQVNSATALNIGRRYLAQYKNRRFRLTNGITVKGFIRGKGRQRIPACQIRAGQRVRIGSYIDDGSGTWQTYLITHTEYDDESETTRMSVNIPDFMTVFLAQLQAGLTGR